MGAGCAITRLPHFFLIMLVSCLAFWDANKPLARDANLTAKELEDRIQYLSPSQKVVIEFEKKIEFLGCDLTLLASQPVQLSRLTPEFGHNDKFRITYYWRCLQGMDRKYQALVRFKGKYGNFNNDHLIGSRAIVHQSQRTQKVGKALYSKYATDEWKIGEVVKESYEVTVPRGIGPGLYEMQMEIVGEQNDFAKGEFIKFGIFFIVSKVFPARLKEDLLHKLFGPNIWNIKKGTTLASGSVVAIDLKDVPPGKGLGIISYTAWSGDIWQGETIARLIVEDESAREFIYNLKQGVDTALAWIDNPKGKGRYKHGKAKVATSWPVRQENIEFKAHTYYTIIDFPWVSRPAKLTIVYTYPKGIIVIHGIALITPG